MAVLIPLLRVLHVITAILMAWPAYALVAVNQRARLGAPLGDRADVYMENIIKNRTIPCFVFQLTVLISGLALVWARGLGLESLVRFPAIGLKFLVLLFISTLLLYVHFKLQPQIDALFAQAHNPVPSDVTTRIGTLRLRRKRLASLCLFGVLTDAMLGMQVWVPFPLGLTILLLFAFAAFTGRVYKSETPYGWV